MKNLEIVGLFVVVESVDLKNKESIRTVFKQMAELAKKKELPIVTQMNGVVFRIPANGKPEALMHGAWKGNFADGH